MELRQVEYFHTLCEELNFTRAAERCGVSQPALTRAIRLLEEEFGGPLFYRAGTRTRLTELGTMVQPHFEEVLQQARAATEQARSFHTQHAIRLRLGLMCSVAPTDLVQLIQNVRIRHPDIVLELIDADARTLEQALRDDQVDAAITGLPTGEEWPEDMHRHPFHREQFVAVTALDHRFKDQTSVRCSDLEGEAFLARVDCEMTGLAEKELMTQGVALRTVYRSTRDDWILAMAAAGLGFALMPSRSVQRPDVIVRPVVDPEFWREISLVTVRGRPHAAAVGALVQEAMRTGPWDGRTSDGRRDLVAAP